MKPLISDKLDFLWLEITEKCNEQCVHCYGDFGPALPLSNGMELADWQRVIRQASEMGCKMVQFIGGEPTLHPNLSELIRYAFNSGVAAEVFTNATLINDGLLQVMTECGTRVATSFYSNQPVVHDAITKRKGSFEKTVKGIQNIIANYIPIRVGIITMSANEGPIEPTEKFLRDIGVEKFSYDAVRGYGRGADLVQLGNKDLMNELCGACGNGKVCVHSDGSVTACIVERYSTFGNVLKQSLEDVYLSQPHAEFSKKLFEVKGWDCTPAHPVTEVKSSDHLMISEHRSCAVFCDSCRPSCAPDDKHRPWCHPNSCHPNHCKPYCPG